MRSAIVGVIGEVIADHGGRGPDEASLLLFLDHVIQDGSQPRFKTYVVDVGHQQISNSVDSTPSN